MPCTLTNQVPTCLYGPHAPSEGHSLLHTRHQCPGKTEAVLKLKELLQGSVGKAKQ